MNKPFYGAASIPKSERRIIHLTQLKLLANRMYPDLALMTLTKKKGIMIYPNGGIIVLKQS